MTYQVVKTIHNAQRNRRVELFQRKDGTFGFQEWTYAADEDAWVPFGRYAIAVIDTLERTEQEARGRIAWLASA
jgi:hypothetical protein